MMKGQDQDLEGLSRSRQQDVDYCLSRTILETATEHGLPQYMMLQPRMKTESSMISPHYLPLVAGNERDGAAAGLPNASSAISPIGAADRTYEAEPELTALPRPVVRTRLIALPAHSSTDGTAGTRHACPQCPLSFTVRKSLYRHIRSRHDSNTFECSICEDSFARRDIKDRHEREQHDDDGPATSTCPYCGKRVSGRYAKLHQRSRVCTEAQRVLKIRHNGSQPSITSSSSGLSTIAMLDPLVMTLTLCGQCTDLVDGTADGKQCCYREWKSPMELRSKPQELCATLDVAYRTIRNEMSNSITSTSGRVTLLCSTYLLMYVEAVMGNFAAAGAHKKACLRLLHPVNDTLMFENHLGKAIEELGLVSGVPLEQRMALDATVTDDVGAKSTRPLSRIYYVWSPRERARVYELEALLSSLI